MEIKKADKLANEYGFESFEVILIAFLNKRVSVEEFKQYIKELTQTALLIGGFFCALYL